MKKLIVASAAVVAATLFSGNAFAIPGSMARSVEAPAAAVKVSCGCHHPHHYYRHTHTCGCCSCGGYYSLYTYTTPCCGYSACGGCGGGCGGWRLGGSSEAFSAGRRDLNGGRERPHTR